MLTKVMEHDSTRHVAMSVMVIMPTDVDYCIKSNINKSETHKKVVKKLVQ